MHRLSPLGVVLHSSKLRLIGLLAPFLALSGLCTGCNSEAPAKGEKPIEVVVTKPVSDTVIDYQDFTGRLDALKTVDIRARASGFITKAPFKEGDVVHEGDLLFEIDRRPYEAALHQTEANVKVAEADRNLQERVARRATVLLRGRSISQEDYDTAVATSEKAQANVGALDAARNLAKLNLDYTEVRAPLTGRVSRRLVDPGNLVTADNTLLTTLVADNPLYAYFDVDERTYLNLVGSGKSDTWIESLHLPVLVRLANEDEFSRTAVVDFVDNRVSATSGTIRMRATLENPKGTLKAGLFVRVRLPVGQPYKALLIPDEAVQSDQGRKYIYVVNGQSQVEYRAVEPGQEIQGLRAIKKNLAAGERVIVAGMQRVKQKATVEVKEQEPPKAPESPLARLLKGRLPATTESQDASPKSKGADKKTDK